MKENDPKLLKALTKILIDNNKILEFLNNILETKLPANTTHLDILEQKLNGKVEDENQKI